MYILNASEQEELIHKLVLTKTLEGGWSRKYQNPVTDENWLEFYVVQVKVDLLVIGCS
jgi:hypothetical protein